jgi:GAF domain-containing protein
MAKLAKVPERSGMLHDLSMLVSQPFPALETCLPVMLPVITRHLRVSSAFVSQFTPDNLNFLGAVDESDSGLLHARSEPILETFCQYVYATGAPVVIGDASLDVRVQTVGLRSKFSIGAYIGVPIIRSSGAIYGTLCALDAQHPQERHLIIGELLGLGVKRAERPVDCAG